MAKTRNPAFSDECNGQVLTSDPAHATGLRPRLRLRWRQRSRDVPVIGIQETVDTLPNQIAGGECPNYGGTNGRRAEFTYRHKQS